MLSKHLDVKQLYKHYKMKKVDKASKVLYTEKTIAYQNENAYLN